MSCFRMLTGAGCEHGGMTTRRRRLRRSSVVLGAISMAVAVLIVLLTASASTHVTQPPPPSGYVLSLGWPLEWIEQHTTLTPPLPYDIALGDPMSNPTDIDARALALDVLAFWAPLMLVAATLRALSTGRRRPRAVKAG